MNLDLIFNALSDSTRREILTRLIDGEKSVGELAQPFNISLAAISKHLKVLENAGLISRRKDKQTRLCNLHYSAFKEIDQYLAIFRRAWNARHDRL
jgi:DNA-binding transcriptional ArsR family regulator